MHLLREGQFAVAATFLSEIAEHKMDTPTLQTNESASASTSDPANLLDLDEVPSTEIRKQFASMYYILQQLQEHKNLLPAIEWSREHRNALEARGSNLEFELCRLQYVWLYHGGSSGQGGPTGWQEALAYARREFHVFVPRYLREVQQLIGAMAYSPNLEASPYASLFNTASAWDDVAHFFTREFCSLLGLSADSPLYIAATAGAIALPTLLKLQTIMRAKRTEWTSENELPVGESFPSNKLSIFILTLHFLPGRNLTPALIPLPLDLRLPRIQGTSDRCEPTNDDALRTCHRRGITEASWEEQPVQVPILSKREPPQGRAQSVPVKLFFLSISFLSPFLALAYGAWTEEFGIRMRGSISFFFGGVKASAFGGHLSYCIVLYLVRVSFSCTCNRTFYLNLFPIL